MTEINDRFNDIWEIRERIFPIRHELLDVISSSDFVNKIDSCDQSGLFVET